MGNLGVSLIFASGISFVVWYAFRGPPLIDTFLALWRRWPAIEQPPSTASPPPSRTSTTSKNGQPPVRATGAEDAPSVVLPTKATSTKAADRLAMPPPPVPVLSVGAHDDASGPEASPQTTPKASATLVKDGVPSFVLSPEPPSSAAAVARSNPNPNGAAIPSLAGPTIATPAGVMAPPPRPPTLAPLPNRTGAGGSLMAPPARPIPNRQPGSSTLGPPPTHSSKPAKPSRQVVLTPGHSPLDWARLANGPTSDLRNLPPGTPYLRVPRAMLKRQTGRKGKDAWTALGGKVYNITPYLPFHPGGEAELLKAAGRDGTKLFGEIHPWVNYETMLGSSLVGLLVEDEEAGSGMDDMD